ncbi:MAG: GatB/YqeY domain-containing protein [Gammaproteobacteria bacterium]|nr:GatB/YqeY domain-containing protein [Gammaproteobacteria bacterium]
MSDSALKTKIINDMKDAMRAQEKLKLQTIRLITAAIKQREVDDRIELTDQDILMILDKMVKQRRDSVKQYEAAQREDLAAQERFEIELIQGYLPQALSDAEIEGFIQDAIQASGAANMQDMSKVMQILRPKVQGRADMGAVSQKIKQALS